MKQCLLVFFFSSFFFNTDSAELSILDFNDLILHSDIVLFATVIDECHSHKNKDKTFIQFKIGTQIKGELDQDLFVTSKMLYQGDIFQELKTLEIFDLNEDYLIFLQRNEQSLTLLNQYTLKKVDSDGQEKFIPIMNQSDHAEDLMYTKSDLIHAIEGFVYNETEILRSEILAE